MSATPGSDDRLSQALEELEAARFIAQASSALAQVADYESTLERIANLAVPAFADWFGVHVREDGAMRRFAVRHRDARMVRAVEELYAAYPPDEEPRYGAPLVMATGTPIFAPDFAAAIPAIARDGEHARRLRAIGLRSFICVPMRSHGRMLGTLTFATAESGRTYAQTQLEAAEDLAARCAIAIENAQLLGELRDADRRKDEFIAILAHELRNPLAPMRNAVEIMRVRAGHVPEAQWASGVLERQVRQLSRLVDDLLDVSRISRGTIALRKERFALSAAIEAAVESSRPAMERSRHELELAVPAEPIHLDADPLRISQVLSNLLNNAARYTPPGGKIALVAERDGEEAVVRVIDSGDGIPREMLERVFEMFVQVPATGTAAQGGLGIGLTIVKRLVEMHGGTVVAKSAGPGTGSEFVVRLPLARDASLPERTPEQDADNVAAGPSTRRILVVDDNRDAAESLAYLLSAKGHAVRIAYDGVEAMAQALAFQPDVVLLDIGLPLLQGHEVGRRIRQQRGGDVLLIAVTGWGHEDDRRRSRDAGFDHHFTKPVDLERLHAILARSRAPEPAQG